MFADWRTVLRVAIGQGEGDLTAPVADEHSVFYFQVGDQDGGASAIVTRCG